MLLNENTIKADINPLEMDTIRAPYKRTRVIASQGEEMEQHIVTPGLVLPCTVYIN